MKKKGRLILPAAIIALLVSAVFVVLMRSPVLLRIPDYESIRGYPWLIVLNPFRNKEPETAAEIFLQGLRDGNCLELTSSFSQERSTAICKKQLEYPLSAWELIDLDEENGTYSLSYKHVSAGGSENMTVWVNKDKQTRKVVSFVIGY